VPARSSGASRVPPKGCFTGTVRVLSESLCPYRVDPKTALSKLREHLNDSTGRTPHCYFGWTEGNPTVYLFEVSFADVSGLCGGDDRWIKTCPTPSCSHLLVCDVCYLDQVSELTIFPGEVVGQPIGATEPRAEQEAKKRESEPEHRPWQSC
jgi:hypothetical protein